MKPPPSMFSLKAPIALTVHPVPTPAVPAARAGTIRPRRRALATVYEAAFRQLTFLISGEALRGPALLGIAGSAVVVLWRRMRCGRAGADFAGGETEPNRVEQHALQNASVNRPIDCTEVQSSGASSMPAEEGTGTTNPSKGVTCQR
jgi:hypothetical protein